MKAIVLAGAPPTPQERIGTPAPFLLLEGRPLLLYILVALDGVDAIDEIQIFGPQKDIMKVIEDALPHFFFSKPIRVQEQSFHFKDIFFPTRNAEGAENPLKLVAPKPTILLVPGNVPLVTPGEIEAFLEAANLSDYEMAVGLSPAQHPLSSHSTRKNLVFCTLDDGVYRPNNLVLLPPLQRISPLDKDAGPTGPSVRMEAGEKKKADSGPDDWTDWTDCLPRCYSTLLKGGLPVDKMRKMKKLSGLKLSLEDLEDCIYKLLKIKVNTIKTKLAYASIHVHNEAEVRSLEMRLKDWRDDLLALSKKGGNPCPFSGDRC